MIFSVDLIVGRSHLYTDGELCVRLIGVEGPAFHPEAPDLWLKEIQTGLRWRVPVSSGGSNMHVDLLGSEAGTAGIQVEARGTAFLTHGTALGGVEVNAVDGTTIREESVGSTIEVDGVRAGTGAAVQVTHLTLEVAAAHVLHNLIEAVVIIQRSGGIGGTAVLDVEVGDITVVQTVGADSGLVEQVDSFAVAPVDAFVQVVVDDLPAVHCVLVQIGIQLITASCANNIWQ